MVPQLCWTADGYSNEMDQVTPKRAPIYRAPSWSWLSIDSNLDFYTDDDGKVDKFRHMLEVLDTILLYKTQKEFGSILSRDILGRGMLKLASLKHESDGVGRYLELGNQAVEQGEFWNHKSSQVMIDVGLEETCDDVMCLPLLSHDILDSSFTNGYYVGLVLKAKGRGAETYERIGAFQIDFELGDALLKADSGDGSRTMLSRRTFTIL